MDPRCPICDSDQSELFLDGDDNEISLQSVGSSRTLLSHGRVLRCQACGLAYRSFRPQSHQLASLYRAADDSRYEAEMPNRWRTAVRHRKIISSYISGKKSLLDIGCASGAFLQAMRAAGWDVHGVEPSASQYERASRLLGIGAQIQQCMLQDAVFSQPFDLVTLWDVLEHVTEPAAFLQLAASHLKPGGYLVLNVPRVDSWIAGLLRSRWPLLLAEHLNYFSVRSLGIGGESAGLLLMDTGQRPSSFSLGYIFYRASQHKIPGSRWLQTAVNRSKISQWSLPVWLGEVYAVYQKTG